VEVNHNLGTVPTALPHPHGVIDAAERAIIEGRIAVASALPAVVTVSFDPHHPSDPPDWTEVAFANEAVAMGFLGIVLQVPEIRSVFTEALEHPVSRQMTAFADVAVDDRLPQGDSDLARQASRLLVAKRLGLRPRHQMRHRLWLVWLERRLPGVAVVAEAPSVARAAPLPSVAAPMSSLPDPPDELSPQAQALIEAAQRGAPFCEECARRAAEVAGA
jgi:hypothetical protein